MSEPSELQKLLWRWVNLANRYKRDVKREKTRAQLWEGKASILRHENNQLRRRMERDRAALAARDEDVRALARALNDAVGTTYDAGRALAAEETLQRYAEWLEPEK